MTLEELRKRLSDVDRELIGLVAARQSIVAEIGAHKIRTPVPTRDYEREREVLKGAHEHARALGSSAGSLREIMALLIRCIADAPGADTRRGADERRRQARSDHRRRRQDGRVVRAVPGSQGFAVEIADPSEAPSPFPRVADWLEQPDSIRISSSSRRR